MPRPPPRPPPPPLGHPRCRHDEVINAVSRTQELVCGLQWPNGPTKIQRHSSTTWACWTAGCPRFLYIFWKFFLIETSASRLVQSGIQQRQVASYLPACLLFLLRFFSPRIPALSQRVGVSRGGRQRVAAAAGGGLGRGL
jgi:hypothetical protein